MPHDPIFLKIEVKRNDTEDSFETNLHCSRNHCGEIVNIDSDGPKTIQRVSCPKHGLLISFPRTNNPQNTITHRQCAVDTLRLLDHLEIKKCRAIGLSMGGNILLHMATRQPDRIESMVVVSAAMYFPEQARAIMRQVLAPESQAAAEWETMRKRHKLGDQQIVALWNWTREMKDSYDDMNFTASSLSKITAATLIVYGDRDPLYPIEMAVDMYHAIPRSAFGWCRTGAMGPSSLTPQINSHRQRLRFFENRLNGRS